jgi:hypothetical protein
VRRNQFNSPIDPGLYHGRETPCAQEISVQNGEQFLFDEIRYFFYITNRTDYAPEQIVSLANGRCNQRM